MDRKKSKKEVFFADQMEEIFVKNFKSYEVPEVGALLAENVFYIRPGDKSEKFSKFYLQLFESKIFFSKAKNKKSFGYMDIENIFLRKSETKIKDRKFYSLKFIKPHSYEEIFQADKEIINEWFELLKRFCILVKFNRYFKSIKVLGKGSFAMVYQVERLKTGAEYAVKVFSKRVFKDKPKDKLGLLNEIKIMRKIKHPKIIQFIELYEGENHIYLLMQLCKGDNLLNHLINNGYQPEKKALNLLRQVLEGIKYLHDMDIIHRDIKPENIIFSNDKKVSIQIVDLGFACEAKEYEKLFARCGTPGYIAPEILLNKTYDTKVDIFSIGVIFYIILTGRMPFSGSNFKEIIARNKEATPDYNFSKYNITVSADSINLLKKMLAKNPDKRLTAEQALHHEVFSKLLSTSPLVTRKDFMAEDIIQNQEYVRQEEHKKLAQNPYVKNMPEKIEDLSPLVIKEKSKDQSDVSDYQFQFFNINFINE